MRVSCLQKKLLKGLRTVRPAVAARSLLPILAGVRLEARENRLHLTASNLDMTLSCQVAARVEEEGGIVVPARPLVDFVRLLPPERVDIELDGETKTLTLRCAQAVTNIKGWDLEEFIEMPMLPEGPDLKLNAATLQRMITWTAFAVRKKESWSAMSGVLLRCEEGKLTLVATDGCRLSICHTPCSCEKPATAILSTAASMGNFLSQPAYFLSLAQDSSKTPFSSAGNPQGRSSL